ncbi:MAG: hypothetical protein LBF27_02035 [Sphingobacterium sp.]|jgi:hypothetical protein|nr:hypothetical protein [Sphingobacterium sp.]
MGVYDLFSKRQKRLNDEVPDVFTYGLLTEKLKIQIIHIYRNCIGYSQNEYVEDIPKGIFTHITDILREEYGRFNLAKTSSFYKNEDDEELTNFFLESVDSDKVLDVVELVFRAIESVIAPIYSNSYKDSNNSKLHPEQAIKDLNTRFKENGFGYSFEAGQIIRIDSTLIHSEITKPTLKLLAFEKFIGANEEYLVAHDHYKHGRNKECLTNCLKAFESTMKIICKEKGWEFQSNASSRSLIQICFKNELIPNFIQNQFTSLQNLLESGIPTIRNKIGAHGQGNVTQKVNDEMTRYALNLTGSNIILLIEQSGIK